MDENRNQTSLDVFGEGSWTDFPIRTSNRTENRRGMWCFVSLWFFLYCVLLRKRPRTVICRGGDAQGGVLSFCANMALGDAVEGLEVLEEREFVRLASAVGYDWEQTVFIFVMFIWKLLHHWLLETKCLIAVRHEECKLHFRDDSSTDQMQILEG